jgi:hypothetical protein
MQKHIGPLSPSDIGEMTHHSVRPILDLVVEPAGIEDGSDLWLDKELSLGYETIGR